MSLAIGLGVASALSGAIYVGIRAKNRFFAHIRINSKKVNEVSPETSLPSLHKTRVFLEARLGQPQVETQGEYVYEGKMVNPYVREDFAETDIDFRDVGTYRLDPVDANLDEIPEGIQHVMIPDVLVATAQINSQFRVRTDALLLAVKIKVQRAAENLRLTPQQVAHFVPLAVAKGFVPNAAELLAYEHLKCLDSTQKMNLANRFIEGGPQAGVLVTKDTYWSTLIASVAGLFHGTITDKSGLSSLN